MAATAGAGVLEREGDLARAAAALDRARGGVGALVVIEGPPGIGKTTLLRAVQAQARESGMEVLGARGGELEREFPWGVVRQLFERPLTTAVADERHRLLEGAARLAVTALALAPNGHGDVARDVDAILHGLYWLTVNWTARAPLAIVVDDAQWIDPDSRRYLAHLARRIEGLPAALVVASREPEPGVEEALLHDLLADPDAELLHPAPLSAGAVARVAAGGLGAEPDDAFASAFHRTTGGNPLLVDRLLRTLVAERVAPTASAAERLAELAPRSVPRSLLAQLEGLPPACSAMARALAVLGGEADLQEVTELAGLERPAAAEAASALMALNALDDAYPLRFQHPVVRGAVYAAVAPAERLALHARAARLLDARGAPLERVAGHLLAVEPAGDSWVFEQLRRTAAEAVARGAPDAAVTYLERAVREPPPSHQRADVLAELGVAELHAGAPGPAAQHLRDSMAATEDPVTRARRALPAARALQASAGLSDAVALLERAIDELGDRDRDLRLRMEAELAGAGFLADDTVARTEARLHALAEVDGKTTGECLVLAARARAAHISGRPARLSAELARRALAPGRLDVGDAIESLALHQAVLVLLLADDLDTAERAIGIGEAVARERGSPTAHAYAMISRGTLAWRRGDLVNAEADMRIAVDVFASFSQMAPLPVGFLAQVLVARGDLDAAERALAGLALPDPPPRTSTVARVDFARGLLRAARGDDAAALADVLEAGRREQAHGIRSPSVPWRSTAALLQRRLGQEAAAIELADEEVALARAWELPSALGVALRARGLLASGEEQLALLREALDALERSPSRLEQARGLLELGAAERRAGHRKAARPALERAGELARACGALPELARAQDELRAAGAPARRLAFSGVEDLTASERRVADLAAAGRTNKEIAQELFVTAKTVENHLSRVYRKLDIRSRDELAGVLETGPAAGG